MPEISTTQKYVRIFGLPEEDIAHADYDIFTNILTVTYGIDQPRYKQKKVTRRASKEFADFFTAPIFVGKSVDYILTAYLKAKGMDPVVREGQRPAKVYYTSSDPVFDKITMGQFIETEVEERGNYTHTEVKKWMGKYGLSMNDLAIWVSPLKWVANRYTLLAQEWDKAKFIPESEMNVSEIRSDEGFIIPESDDGEGGYLFVFKENLNLVVREAVNHVPEHERANRIIEEIKASGLSPKEKRKKIGEGLKALADGIDRSVYTAIKDFRPLGIMSEIGMLMGAQPRKGVRIDTPFGAYVFDNKRVPSKEMVDSWYAQHKEADTINTLAVEYAFGLEAHPNTVTGNFRVVEHARRLRAQGLLSPEEEHVLNALEKYWEEHPELDRQKGYGIWGYNLEIMVPERLRKNIIEKKESLIDALLKIESGKDIQIDYNDIPKGADRVSLPSNLRGSVIERRGDFIVAAIQSDVAIVAYLYVRKDSQLIQIRPIPRQKMQVKAGEMVNTPEYNSWVERIKREAPEYLPEWEKIAIKGTEAKQPWEMTYREFAEFFEEVWGGQRFTFAERVGKPLGIQSQAGEPYHMIKGRRIGYSGSLSRDRWRLAIVDKALSEGKKVPEDVLAELAESLKKEKEKLGGTGMAEPQEGTQKEPWEMTKEEYWRAGAGGRAFEGRGTSDYNHMLIVGEAFSKGKPIPTKVLRDYPKLAESYPVNKTWRMNRAEALNFLGSTNMDLHRRAIKEALEVGLTPYLGWEKDYPELLSPEKTELPGEKGMAEPQEKPSSQEEMEKRFRALLNEGKEKGFVEREKEWIDRFNDPTRSKENTILDLEGLIKTMEKRTPPAAVGSPYEVKAMVSFIPRERVWSTVLEDSAGYCHGAQNYPRLREALDALETRELEQDFDRESARQFYIRQIGLDPENPENLEQIMAEYSEGHDPRRGIKITNILYSDEVKAQIAMLEHQYTSRELDALNIEDLKKIALAKGAKTTGKKDEVVKAILQSQGEKEMPPASAIFDIYTTGYSRLSLVAVTQMSDIKLAEDLTSAIPELSKEDALKIAPQVRALAQAKAKEMEAGPVTQAVPTAEQAYIPQVGDMVRVKKPWGSLTTEDVLEVVDVNELFDAQLIKKISPRETVKYGATRATNLILVKRAEMAAHAKAKEDFWSEVKDLKIVDIEVKLVPGEGRPYKHIYEQTFAILENGKKVLISSVIYKEKDAAEALKLGPEFFKKRKQYYIGETVGKNVRKDTFLNLNRRYEEYQAQKPIRMEVLERFPTKSFLEPKIRDYGNWIRENTYGEAGVRRLQTGSYEQVIATIKEFIRKYYNLAPAPADYIFRRPKYQQTEIGVDSLATSFFNVAANGWDLAESFKEWEVGETRQEWERRLKEVEKPLPTKPVEKPEERILGELRTKYRFSRPEGDMVAKAIDSYIKIRDKPIVYSILSPVRDGKFIAEDLMAMVEGTYWLKKEAPVPVPQPPAPSPAAKVQSTQEIMQQTIQGIQQAKTLEELKQVLRGIGFLPLPDAEKRQLMDLYQNKYSMLASERPLGERVPVEEKPKVIGAPTRQELAEAEMRRKAEEGKKLRGQVELGGAVTAAARLGLFELGAMEKAKAEAEAKKRIEQLGLPYEIHPFIKKLAESTQEVLKFGSKRKETLEDLVLARYVRYCPAGTIVDNRNIAKVPERWWVYPGKLRSCMTEVQQKIASAGTPAGVAMVKEAINVLTPSMRQYIQSAKAIRDVVHYFVDRRKPPIRGVLYRARDGTYFVEAQDGQIYTTVGWEDVGTLFFAGEQKSNYCRARA